MDCFMCSSANRALQKLQTDFDIEILRQITFVLPNIVIPDTKEPVYACASCLEQVETFYEIKISCLENNRRLNLYKDILKGVSDVTFNGLKIANYSNELSVKLEQNTEFQINLHCKDPLSLEDEDKFTGNDSKQSLNKERRFKCGDCDKAFIWGNELKIHSRIHTGERPYKCQTCQKTFTQCGTLTKHKLIHTGEKPHECDVCHKSFTEKTNLTKHKRSHGNVRPYQCAVCNMAFTRSTHLTEHTRIHTGDKPHQCPVCQFECLRSSGLKIHLRTHTGEKPYTCKLCQTSFAQLANLRKHQRRLHNNEHLN